MKKELLAPAGDFETLKQAVHHGADAVYLGGKKFGARKFASNFDDEEMKEAISYCHLYGVKIYVTVNTMIYEEELESVIDYVSFLYHNKVDAIIVQDLGLISVLRKKFPNLELHASTQLHNHNQEGLRLLEELGVKRVVLSRELSLDEINKLNTTMEIECFIHGALCVCYSGQCLFSSMLLDRSGNRGACAGICRLPFDLLEDGKKVDTLGKYLLSPRELNSMNHIQELMESNITSFKIEGRMKSPTTIGFIVSLYRKLIDGYNSNRPYLISEEEHKELLTLFNREFTSGFLFKSRVQDLMNIKSPNHIGTKIGKVVSINKGKVEILLEEELLQEDGIRFLESETGMIVNFLYDKSNRLVNKGDSGGHIFVDEKVSVKVGDTVMKTLSKKLLSRLEIYESKKIPLQMEVTAKYPNPFLLKVKDIDNNEVIGTENILSLAEKSATTKERVIEQLMKTGNTPFEITDIKIEMDDNLFIPIASINKIRRELLEKMENIRRDKKQEIIEKEVVEEKIDGKKEKTIYTALVRNIEQLRACMDCGIDEFYTPDFSLYQKMKEEVAIYYRVDRVLNSHPDFSDERLLVGELGSIYKYKNHNKMVSDYYLNVVNHSMVNFLHQNKVSRITLSVEATKEQVHELLSNYENPLELEIILYGRIEVMITKYCPLSLLVHKKNEPCNCCRNGHTYSLRDRNGAVYPLIQSRELTHIFHHTPIERTKEEYLPLGIHAFRFEFFDEDYDEVLKVIKKLKGVL